MYTKKKIQVLDKLFLVMNYNTVGCEFKDNQLLKKMSLNTSTYKTMIYSQVVENVILLTGIKSFVSPKSNNALLAISAFAVTLQTIIIMNNKNPLLIQILTFHTSASTQVQPSMTPAQITAVVWK